MDVEKPEEVRLIDLDETHSGEHTVFIMPPEEPQEADGSECPAPYRYRVTAVKASRRRSISLIHLNLLLL